MSTTKNTATASIPVLRKGSEGDTVFALQVLLAGYGYLQGRYVTGKYDDQTVTAVKDYQRDNKLSYIDGICGKQTWGSLLGT